jgi:hypothetical protein
MEVYSHLYHKFPRDSCLLRKRVGASHEEMQNLEAQHQDTSVFELDELL